MMSIENLENIKTKDELINVLSKLFSDMIQEYALEGDTSRINELWELEEKVESIKKRIKVIK